MSGFFGVMRHDGEPVDTRLLQTISKKMVFRGQDANNIWQQGNLGSCFALMKTGPAKQAAYQPVVWDDRFRLWGDIRLDGRIELRESLGERDFSRNTDATSEDLLLRAWAKWGAGALDRILGDFSFALWDAKEEVLWCARDFIGGRPFYYAHLPRLFCFGNTLQILPVVPEISGELDEVFLGDFLIDGGRLDQDRTVYRDIKRLPAGHLLKWSKNNIEVRRFRRLPIEEPLRLQKPGEYLEMYRQLMRTCVSDRLPEDSAALYLSGGLDSGAICAVASRVAEARGRKEELKAFTLSWRPFLDDPEPALAQLTAQHLHIEHEILEEKTLEPFEGAHTEDGRTPEPNEEMFFLKERRNSQRIAAYSTVVLGGDGGDEVLTGRAWPYLRYLWREGKWTTMAQEVGSYVWTHKRLPPLRTGLRGRMRDLLTTGSQQNFPDWIDEDFSKRINLKQRWLDLNNRTPKNTEHPVHPFAYELFHDGIWATVLEVEDAGWNRVMLESRSPLLDLRMLRFFFRLPPIPWCMTKYLCRQAMRGNLPERIVQRPKTPLVADPIDRFASPSNWAGRLSGSALNPIERFVNSRKWCETLYHSRGSLRATVIRPVSLCLWLTAVEVE